MINEEIINDGSMPPDPIDTDLDEDEKTIDNGELPEIPATGIDTDDENGEDEETEE